MAVGHEGTRATWPWGEQVRAQCKCGSLGEKEREVLCSLVLYQLGLGVDQVLFQKNQSAFQAFVGF